MNREQTLLAALRFATAYVQKAVADGLMEDCAVPASVALARLRAVLAGQEETDVIRENIRMRQQIEDLECEKARLTNALELRTLEYERTDDALRLAHDRIRQAAMDGGR